MPYERYFYLKQDLMFLIKCPLCHVKEYPCDKRNKMYCLGYYTAYNSRGQLF